MKKFEFRLGRVLDCRRTQATLEEMKLGRLQTELRDIEGRIAYARAEQSDSERAILETNEVTAEALAALDSFKKSVAAECARLEGLASAARRRIAQQLAIVLARRQNTRLLEKIEAKKLAVWTAGYRCEIDLQAEEACASRNHRSATRSPSRTP